MKHTELAELFDSTCHKKLSAVEVDADSSNQHEFNSVSELKVMFGTDRLTNLSVKFIYQHDEDELRFSEEGMVTWYDARENHPSRSEYRLYFKSNQVMNEAVAGDHLFIIKMKNENVILLIVPENSTSFRQLQWLFKLPKPDKEMSFSLMKPSELEKKEIDSTCSYILEQIGIECPPISDDNYLDLILGKYPDGFPSTRDFSAFARENANTDTDCDYDRLLMSWWETETYLFHTYEKYLVNKRLQKGFDNVDDFFAFSLSAHNKRKARAGFALENHLEEIFTLAGLNFSRNPMTENRSKPDFLFPSITSYQNLDFPADKLVMLGVKTTCKDRWRQVTTEASRITKKHLFTLEPGISNQQTAEMQENSIQLVVPSPIHSTYNGYQLKWLYSLSDFIEMVNEL